MPQLLSGIFRFYAHKHTQQSTNPYHKTTIWNLETFPLLQIFITSINVSIPVLYVPLTENVKLDLKLTFSADHLSWECSAYLLAKYSSFSGRDMLGKVNA